MKAGWLAAALVALAACAGGTAAQTSQPAAAGSRPSESPPPAVHVAHQPPTAKDVIAAAIASGSLPLSISPTCANAGTERSDSTVARYLAGFLAELSSPAKKNWIETKIEPGRSRAGEAVSICTLTLRHEDGDDRWGWGVRFQVRSSDGLVLNDTFSCVGAG